MRTWWLAILVLGLTTVACEDGATAPGTDELATDDGLAVAVLPGKADDYLSPTSREYRVWGVGQVALEATWGERTADERKAEVERRLGYRFKAYAHFVNEYLTDKEHEEANRAYGGFAGLVRGTSLDWIHEPVDDAGLLWAFVWEIEMGGPRELMDRLPFRTRDDGTRYLVVQLPVLTESQLENASYPKSFDPATYTGTIEEVEVGIDAVEESFDAWPDFPALFADGVLDGLILVGGDYNAERYDLKAAQEIFTWLKRAGYEHPAATFAELTLESPPFTKTLTANGKEVRVALTLLHPDIVPDDRLAELRARVIGAFETMDLVLYDGHAGQDPSYSGVVYHYNPRAAISANDLATLALPEKYQLYVFNGCKTYSAYPEALYANATKDVRNLDIVSTVNFSWLTMQPYTTSGFLNELLAVRSGSHDPRTYQEILLRINGDANHNVYYGVHGIDDNAHRNPYADAAALCRACTADSDCPGVGNRCIRYDWGRACAAECTAADGCPDGYTCSDIAEGGRVTGKQCLPTSFRCE